MIQVTPIDGRGRRCHYDGHEYTRPVIYWVVLQIEGHRPTWDSERDVCAGHLRAAIAELAALPRIEVKATA